MKHTRVTLAGVCLVFGLIVMLSNDLLAFSQHRSREYMGKPHYGSSNQRASRSISHARDYSRDFYYYTRDAHTVDPEIAKSEFTELAGTSKLRSRSSPPSAKSTREIKKSWRV